MVRFLPVAGKTSQFTLVLGKLVFNECNGILYVIDLIFFVVFGLKLAVID